MSHASTCGDTTYSTGNCTGDTSNPTVTIDSAISGYAAGQLVILANSVSGSTATMTDGSVKDVLAGGVGASPFGADFTATNNSVLISGGTVNGIVVGGAAGSAALLGGDNNATCTATGNTVEIQGGTVTGTVAGGAAGGYVKTGFTNYAKCTVNGNTVTLSGGNIGGALLGGLDEISIEGNDLECSTRDLVKDNKLVLKATGLTVGDKVENFEILEFVLPASIKDGDAMLKAASANLSLKKFNLTVDGAPALKKDDVITLIAATGALTISGYPATVTDGEYEFELKLSDDGKNLIAKVIKPLPTYKVNGIAVPTEGGEVKCSPATVNEGDSSTCTVTEKEGYEISSFSVSGSVDASECGDPCVLKNITGDVDVTVEFVKVYKVNEGASEGGTVTCDLATVAENTGTTTCYAAADDGYTFVDGSMTVSSGNGKLINCSGDSCELTNVTSEVTVSATFTKDGSGGVCGVDTLDPNVCPGGDANNSSPAMGDIGLLLAGMALAGAAAPALRRRREQPGRGE